MQGRIESKRGLLGIKVSEASVKSWGVSDEYRKIVFTFRREAP